MKESKQNQGCFTNNFFIYLKLKCSQVIFERSSQLLGFTKALTKTKAFCKEAISHGAQRKLPIIILLI